MQHLIKRTGVTVVAYDPKAMDNARKLLGDSITYASDKESAAQGAHVLAILTEWQEFAEADMNAIKKLMVEPSHIIDCRFLAKS